MCDLNCANLIDLSLEDDTNCSNTQIKTDSNSQPSNDMKEGPRFILPTWRKRDSLDNNPFDCAQKLVDRIDDPFDVVEKEACLKAKQAIKPESEVKLGNLLYLSNDNLLEEKQLADNPALGTDKLNILKMQELDLESPPVMLNEKQLPDSASGPDTDSNPNSSAESSTSAKLKKNMEYRKRLLKLSISNAAFSSPISRKQSLELEDILGTPVSSMLSRAAEFGEHLLAAESPLKLVEDEENSNFTDSEKNFEADLEMLKIPILSELPSPAVETFSVQKTRNSPELVNESCAALENAFSNLEAIKSKLKAKREEINNNHQQEISSLIHNLKSLISSGEMVNNSKKQQAGELLESLRSALKPCEAEETLKPDMSNLAPQPIKRQGTFDIDLQENLMNVDGHPLVKEIPNCMVSSSATYDGETAEEKQDFNLPEIAPLSPPQYRFQNRTNDIDEKNNLPTDLNDIMEQLSKLLINNSVDNPENKHNPTFIVVMNANQLNHSNFNNSQQSNVDAKQRSAFVATYLENSINDGSPDLTKVNPMARRRTQSLSIHDKVKIVQLPLQPPTLSFVQKRNSVQLDESPPVTTTPPSGKKDLPEFKTPSRMIRRNSYSSGTPYTAQVGMRRTGYGSDCKNSTQFRRAQTLDTHHEGQQQQQAIVRPMAMPSSNLHNFKPDLKKKTKHNTESIMKSSGPLKATIPVKKVAPMIKMSPPTPDKTARSSLHNISLQSHSKISRVPTTPLLAKGGVGFPNACSTPASFTSPIKRTTGPINKPRYSYMSTTPNSKSSVLNSSTSTGLKRRTIAEFKSKSPLKPRVSSVGLAATSSKATAASSRLSTSAGARISKTPIKTTNATTATVKPQIEFEWVMRDEVHLILKKLREILVECARLFPVPLYDNEGKRIEKFHLIAAQDQLKCSVTLTGDSITQADISFKLKRSSSQVQRTAITSDAPWKLQQVQDAANHLQQAINHIDNVDENYKFRSSEEVLQIITELIGALQRGRTSLIIPKKKSIEDLMKGRNMKSLTPNLPEDQAISFFLQCHKLIIAVYQLLNVQGTMKMEATQAECSVGWLNDVLVLFTVGLTLCQQLKDKMNAFNMDTIS